MKFKKKLWALMICLSLVLSPIAASATENEPADPQDTIRTSAMTAEEDAESASSTVEAAPEDESSGQEEVIPDDSSQSDPAESEEPENAEDQNSGSDETDLENGGEEEADLEYSDAEEADLPESDPEEENASGEGVTDDYSESSDSYDTANGSYEYSDPSLESGQNTEETPVEEIVGEVSTVGLTAELAADVVAPTTVWVEATEENGLPIKIDGFKVSGTSVFQLYLPGNANLSKCFLSWDGGAQVRLNRENYESGQCPLPSPSTAPYSSTNTGTAYRFRNGSTNLTTFNIMVYQGSPNVEQVFIDINEDYGTIAAMDGDRNHELTCKGRICINGTWYGMPKIKGRGNYTWWESIDKRPYNVNLDQEIDFGLDTPVTSKWSFLAEIADHSLLCNRSGFALAHKIGVGQDTTSADVWMNGEYQGCYTVTPKYDSFVTNYGFLIEEDNYLEPSGGNPQFQLEGLEEASGWSSCYNRITVKEMGDGLKSSAGGDDAAAEQIRVWLQKAWNAIRSDDGYNEDGKYYTDYIDIESFAKMYLMHEYVKSFDVCAGSLLFHRDGNSDSDKLIAGPLWDLDNAMGSTYQNGSLGRADDRSNGDRRSGQGDFIENITEYKTSLYKTLSKHEDFMEEVILQYNRHRSSFEGLPVTVDGMISDIDTSAKMNHFKVQDIKNYNIHKYDSDLTLGSGEYSQSFLITNDSKTDWPNYAANLKTYITARSKWFENNYVDPNYVDPAECQHAYETIVIREASCTATGLISHKCPLCKNHYEEETPQISHNYQDGFCTMCGEKLINVTISCPEGASVTVLETQDPNGPRHENAESANPRNSDTGMIDCSSGGQVNFIVNIKPGYELDSVTAAPKGTYKNLKPPAETGYDNCYRLTKVSGDLTISVSVTRTESIILRSANVEFEGKLQLVYKLNLPDSVKNDSGAYLRFEKKGTTVDIPVSKGIESGSDTVFKLPIMIPEFGDNVKITVWNGEGSRYPMISESGTDYTEGCEYSVEQYAKNKKDDEASSEKMRKLAEALDDYGTVTQQYFKYGEYDGLEVSDRVTSVTDENLAGFAPIVSDSLPDGVQKATIIVAFNADNTLRITYYLDQDKTASDYEFKLDGAIVTPKERSANAYCIDLENISAPNLDVPHEFSISDGSNTYTINCSALTYAWVMKNHSDVGIQNLGKALYLYNQAANKFFITGN